MPIGLMDIKGQYRRSCRTGSKRPCSTCCAAAACILGPNVKAFEEEAAAYLGTTGAVGVANGTDGLTIALRAARHRRGRRGHHHAVHLLRHRRGHRPGRRHARCSSTSTPTRSTSTPPRIEAAITPRTKAIMPVDLFGLPADADAVARGRQRARPDGRRRRLPGLRRHLQRPPRRPPRRPRRLQLLPHQEPGRATATAAW